MRVCAEIHTNALLVFFGGGGDFFGFWGFWFGLVGWLVGGFCRCWFLFVYFLGFLGQGLFV